MADILLSSLLLLSLLSSFIPIAAKLASSPVVDLSLSWRSVKPLLNTGLLLPSPPALTVEDPLPGCFELRSRLARGS